MAEREETEVNSNSIFFLSDDFQFSTHAFPLRMGIICEIKNIRMGWCCDRTLGII